MRMRHKKNLEKRLDAASEYLITLRTDSKNHNEAKNESHIIDLKEIFGNDNPVYLEIGGGKGQFACIFAEQNPDSNMLCIEKISDVIVLACEKAQKMGLKNVKFVSCDAEYLEAFLPQKSFETIFLNFSCPYPKKSYANHRLTNGRFLEKYKPLLKDGAPIIQKTDNMHFFEYSIEEFSKSGFEISNVSLDLHNSDFEGNIVTEYESRFVAQGMPIYRLEARLKKDD